MDRNIDYLFVLLEQCSMPYSTSDSLIQKDSKTVRQDKIQQVVVDVAVTVAVVAVVVVAAVVVAVAAAVAEQ